MIPRQICYVDKISSTKTKVKTVLSEKNNMIKFRYKETFRIFAS